MKLIWRWLCDKCGRPVLTPDYSRCEIYCETCKAMRTVTTDAPGLIGGTARHG